MSTKKNLGQAEAQTLPHKPTQSHRCFLIHAQRGLQEFLAEMRVDRGACGHFSCFFVFFHFFVFFRVFQAHVCIFVREGFLGYERRCQEPQKSPKEKDSGFRSFPPKDQGAGQAAHTGFTNNGSPFLD